VLNSATAVVSIQACPADIMQAWRFRVDDAVS
jgi:hypothetical protein